MNKKIETVEEWPIDKLIPYARNARTHSDAQVSQLASSIKEWGFTNPIIADMDGNIIAGHGRFLAAQKLGLKTVPVRVVSDWGEAKKKAYIIADNKLALNAGWDDELLKLELEDLKELDFNLDLIGFDTPDINEILNSNHLLKNEHEYKPMGNLREKFGIPPFSILNARDVWWQDRRRAWLELGIKSEKGREAKAVTFLVNANKSQKNSERLLPPAINNGQSVFDPVLTELCYRWWCPNDGVILDPFAGGSVRGIVASKTGRKYIGLDIRSDQVEENKMQASKILLNNKIMPTWITANSRLINEKCSDIKADFVFSCPPYANLEVYSDDPQDISNMSYKDFKTAYFDIIKKSCSLLKNDRFACFVVGEIRDNRGNYYNFVGDTIQAFKEAGLQYYNEAILVTAIASLPLRAGIYFKATRKIGKNHQNVLVFLKGDSKKATEACGECEFGEINEAE